MSSDDEPQVYSPPTRRGSGAFGTFVMAFVMIAVLVAACVVGGYFFYMGGKEAPKFTVTGFDMDDVKPVQAVDPNFTPTQRQTVTSPQPIAGLPGMVEETATVGLNAAKTEQAKRDGPPSGRLKPDQAKREADWLARNSSTLRETQAKLAQITAKYYQKDSVVRDVDAAFAKMGRYMAIKARFDKDGNPFNFARDAIALPEVRAEIARRMKDPAVWKATLGMINEGLKTRPPKSIYDEAKNFMKQESGVSEYLGTEFQTNLRSNQNALGEAMKTQKPEDMTSIMNLAKDVGPMPGMPAIPAAMTQPPKR